MIVMDNDEERDVERMGKEERGEFGSGSAAVREPLLVKNNRLNTTSQLAIVGANVCPIESLDYESVVLLCFLSFLFAVSFLSYLLFW